MKICAGENCHKTFEPKDPTHRFCPECWDKIMRKIQQQKLKYHRVCKTPGCNTIIDDQPENFQYCVSCWVNHNK